PQRPLVAAQSKCLGVRTTGQHADIDIDDNGSVVVNRKGMSVSAADKARDDFGLGVALEIMAISLSEQGEPQNIVLGLWRRAASLAPGNARIAHNLAAFEKRLQGKAAAAWETEEDPVIGESRERWRADEKSQVFALSSH